MFNYAVNWIRVLKENLPLFMQKNRRVDLLLAFQKPFKDIHAQFLIVKASYAQKARFTGEKMYLQKALNLRYDPVGNGIYIQNNWPTLLWLFKETEVEPAPWVYLEWNAATNYLTNEYAQEGLGVYRALNNNVNKLPSANPANWVLDTNANGINYFFNESEYTSMNRFIIMVPVAVGYIEEEMRAIVDTFALAGINYTIQTY